MTLAEMEWISKEDFVFKVEMARIKALLGLRLSDRLTGANVSPQTYRKLYEHDMVGTIIDDKGKTKRYLCRSEDQFDDSVIIYELMGTPDGHIEFLYEEAK